MYKRTDLFFCLHPSEYHLKSLNIVGTGSMQGLARSLSPSLRVDKQSFLNYQFKTLPTMSHKSLVNLTNMRPDRSFCAVFSILLKNDLFAY